MQRSIKGTKRLPRLLSLRVTGTGTAAINEGSLEASLVDNGTGDYTLTFAKAFARTPVVVPSTVTANIICQVAAVSTTAVQIKTFQGTNGTSATDAVFHALVLGWDSADET